MDTVDTKLKEELDKARQEISFASKMQRMQLNGTLVYGGPMTKRWKKCLAWIREDLDKVQDAPILSEVFEPLAPRCWAFYLHPERGWLKYDMRQMFDAIKSDTEVEHE